MIDDMNGAAATRQKVGFHDRPLLERSPRRHLAAIVGGQVVGDRAWVLKPKAMVAAISPQSC
jgi:hypothetical protein